jgi:hypothetical protein
MPVRRSPWLALALAAPCSCLGRLNRKRYLYFGGDPIGTVAIAQVPLYGG